LSQDADGEVTANAVYLHCLYIAICCWW